jgi:hypothetical protein
MAAHALAGLSGRTLRYAEVVPGPTGPRLRRLGAADFDLDAEAAVFRTGDPEALEAVAEALADGLGGTAADTLVVSAHPTATTSFFSRLPVGLDAEVRDGQLRQETALLADLAPTQAVRVRARTVRVEATPGGDREWVHVVHVAEPVHARLSFLADTLGAGGYDVADTTRAAAAVASAPGASLVVGAFQNHTEVAVVRAGAFLFGTHGPSTAPADTAYFALAALQQAGLDAGDLDALLVYGDDATDDRLGLAAEFVGQPSVWLDPFAAFGRRPEAAPGELAAFAPVLGAAL